MLEKYGSYVLLLGLALAASGFLWLLVRAFKERLLWGFAVLFPPAALVFIFRHFRKAVGPVLLFLVSAVLIGGTYAVNYYYSHYVDLGPREKLVEGELHITLTGWDGTDYAVLKARPATVVLQMANPDVTDQTLEYLRGMTRLRELDLNDTQVTDAGLLVLSELPDLQVLRLRKTQVTDQGFRDRLGAKESLRELDLRETQVASKTLREWKEKNKERRFLR